MTSISKPGATSGLPTARGFLPAGTDGHVCIGYNRACKTVRIAITALTARHDDTLTDEQMDAAADEAGVNLPGSEETRAAVRAALAEPLTDGDCNQDLAQAVSDAAEDGRPFRYQAHDGRTVLMVAIPLPADDPAAGR